MAARPLCLAFSVVLALLAHGAPPEAAKPAPETLSAAVEGHKAEVDALQVKTADAAAALRKWYEAALDAVKKDALSRGSLDAVLVTDAERARLDRDLTPEEKGKLPAALQGLRTQYDKARGFQAAQQKTASATSLRAYLATLDALEKRLTQKADIEGAIAVRGERASVSKKLEELAAVPVANVAATPPPPATPRVATVPASPAPSVFASTTGSGATPLVKVASELRTAGEIKSPAKNAIPFDPPNLDRATKARGVLLENEPGAGSKGSTWTVTLQTRGKTAIQFVHPYGSGHVIVEVTPKGVAPCRAKDWSAQPWSSAGAQDFFKLSDSAGKIFPLEFKTYVIVGQLGPAGNYTLKIDGKLVATGNFASPASSAMYASPTPLVLSEAFQGDKLPMSWKPGSAALLLSGTTPSSGDAVICTNITFQAKGQ